MQTIRQLEALKREMAKLRAEGGRLALVPTMGALHAGHMALVDHARAHADHVIASIFVNPMQFGPNEDLSRYPRQEAEDAAMLEAAGVSILWMPPVEVVYPPGFATTVSVAGLGDRLCGANRPGHFDGVATVVAKLFTQVRPDVAVFGEKDWQQLAIIRRMAIDLNLDVEIAGAPPVRDADGLALSARNAYLTPEQRRGALALPDALKAAVDELQSGEAIAAILERTSAKILAGFDAVDYVELVDSDTLEPIESFDREARILAAARTGGTRLIDNFPAPSKK